MRLASVRIGDQDVIAAAVTEESVIEIGNLLELAGDASPHVPRSMRELISGGDARLSEIEAAGSEATADTLTLRAMAPDAWYPPVRHPGKILAVAMNNSDTNARKISAPDHPAFFLKPPSCLIGHGEAVRIRSYYGSVHPKPELALVIGKSTRDIAPEDALDAVYDYTIFNDITSNGMRGETQRVEQHLSYAARHKGSDTFGVLGPWLVTHDEVENPDDLGVECRVGGEVVADDNTGYYDFKVAEVISFISQFQTLEPGDVISLGTASRPGAGSKSIHHADLQTVAGPVSVSIEGLGRQENPVIVEDKALARWRLN